MAFFSAVTPSAGSSICDLLRRQDLLGRIQTILLATVFMVVGVAAQDESRRPFFVYPPDESSNIYHRMDTIIVTYNSFYDTADLYTFCEPSVGSLSQCKPPHGGYRVLIPPQSISNARRDSMPLDNATGGSNVDEGISPGSGGINVGAAAGIGVGAGIGVILLAGAAFWCWRRRKTSPRPDMMGDPYSPQYVGGGGDPAWTAQYYGAPSKWPRGGELNAVNSPVEIASSGPRGGRTHHEMMA
ncbi:hypothetical protein MMYC01_204712 [Madurella mycetomatis]|uniref:Uncharacterized protein n=1 Tax=Madurella mycetomatis TaxID=100816 RepID=A0A175W6Y4_9PEZI|nr:hypothetical protein MMYC01_204712 [Madurella mycetomatis]